MIGEEYMAQALAKAGVRHIFGVVGIPVVGFAKACQKAGIHFYSFRHEQSAAYAASAYGYLTGTPGVCLCVSGPGVVHSLPGLANAQVNCWPMLLLGGSHHSGENYKGAFQEGPPTHMQMVSPYVKFSATPSSLEHFNFCLIRGLAASISGRAGAAYIELPESLLTLQVPDLLPLKLEKIQPLVHSYSLANSKDISSACNLISASPRPLFIIGKGCGYALGENAMLKLVETSTIPFIASPMGKGVIPDNHPLNVSASRSFALQQAETIVLVGVRLNWMFRYGGALSPNANIIQIDIKEEELLTLPYRMKDSHESMYLRNTVLLCGNIPLVLQQIYETLVSSKKDNNVSLTQWVSDLQIKSKAAQKSVEVKIHDFSNQNSQNCDEKKPWMSYFNALGHVSYALSPNQKDVYSVLVSEGANTMDMSRILLSSYRPRARLDAGTYAAMGPAMGYVIASAVVTLNNHEEKKHPLKPCVAVVGDSSFGFSAIEIETAVRYRLPLVIVIINNNGIYSGAHHNVGQYQDINNNISDSVDAKDIHTLNNLAIQLSPTALSPNAKYSEMAVALGAHQASCTVLEPKDVELRIKNALEIAESQRIPVVVNVLIKPEGNTSKLSNSLAFFKTDNSKTTAKSKL